MALASKEILSENIQKNIRVIYGGSVNAKNTVNFVREENIDGLLVGGASLSANEFAKILTSVVEEQ